MNLYQEQFLEKHDLKYSVPKKFLIIASTPRCGSHMLGHALYQTGQFGFPLEYVNPDNLKQWKKRFAVDSLTDVISHIKKNRTSENGVFGIKIHYSHIKEFGGFDKLVENFPDAHFVLLSRQNTLKQAISFAIACQTGVWISGQQAMSNEPVYKYDDVESCLRATIKDNASWRYLLSASRSKYIEMDFDNVCSNLTSAIEEIAKFMDVDVDPAMIPSEHVTKKQKKSINDIWEGKFLEDFNMKSELLNEQKVTFFQRAKRKLGKVYR